MKQKLRFIRVALLTGVLLLSFSLSSMAQLPCDGDPENCPDIPIDGGLSLLLAAGVGYGIKKVRDSRKQEQENAG